MPELEKSIAKGIIHIDNKLVHPGVPPPPARATDARTRTRAGTSTIPSGMAMQANVTVTKIAVEHAWWLPGVAKRFGIDEFLLRRYARLGATMAR
jgi:hypothetical protein